MIFIFSFAGSISTSSLVPSSFSFSSVFAGSIIVSITVSLSKSSSFSIISVASSASISFKNISTGINEQYLLSISLTLNSFANSWQLSLRYNVIAVPLEALLPSPISNSRPPSLTQCIGFAPSLYDNVSMLTLSATMNAE